MWETGIRLLARHGTGAARLRRLPARREPRDGHIQLPRWPSRAGWLRERFPKSQRYRPGRQHSPRPSRSPAPGGSDSPRPKGAADQAAGARGHPGCRHPEASRIIQPSRSGCHLGQKTQPRLALRGRAGPASVDASGRRVPGSPALLNLVAGRWDLCEGGGQTSRCREPGSPAPHTQPPCSRGARETLAPALGEGGTRR